MSRRRNVSPQRRKTIARAVPWDYGIHRLEQRLLFTTLTAGQAQQTFEYEAEGGGVMRIAYYDVTFEAIGVAVNATTNQAVAGNLIQASATAPVAPIYAFNLFTIYVTQSAADSYIIIAPVARVTVPPATGIRADQPFGGGHPILVDPANGTGGQYSVTPGADVGAGFLGAFTFAVTGGEPANIPITTVTDPGALGVYPGNVFGDGLLHAGLYVPDNATTGLPQSLEAFKFAGEVFGNVEISGNIQLFYAGALLTGDATGDLHAAAESALTTGNFTIGGDIQNLITAGDIGGDVGNAAAGALPNYGTNFTGIVAGKVGQVYELNGGFFGTLDVEHLSSVVGLTDETPPQKIEYQNTGTFIVGDTGGIGQIFQGDTNYLSTLLPDQLPAPFTINTDATPQYLGTAQTVGSSGAVVLTSAGDVVYDTEVSGTLQNDLYSEKDGDPADWYAVSMLAGVTMTISVTGGDQTDILAELEDPDGRLVASDVKVTSSGEFEYTTDRPGIYKIGLLPKNTTAQALDLPYVLKITGTGNEAVGALAVAGDVSDMGFDGFLTVNNGDFGGVVSGASILSGTTGPTAANVGNGSLFAPSSIIVAQGDLRTVEAASIGYLAADGTLSHLLYLSVPNGNVGLVEATGTGAADVLDIATQFDPNFLTGFKTDDAYSHAIGGSIEVISAAATFFGEIGTNAGIGTIRAANMATDIPSYIDVNADNTGNDGIIDLIDVTGDFGTLKAGGPGIVTNQGGNVRYLVVGGTVYRDDFFGGGIDEPIAYNPGQVVTMTDDSGTTLTITPVGLVTTTVIKTTTTTPVTTGNTTTNTSSTTTVTSLAGPQIVVLSYGIRDKGGQVPISISCNVSTGTATNSAAGTTTTTTTTTGGSLSITASGSGGAAAQADIGTVTINGAGSPIVAGGTDQFGNPTISQTAVTINASTGSTSTTTTGTNTSTGATFTTTTTVSGGGTSTQLSLVLSGTAKLNVLNVVSSGDATLIENNTSGEIADVTAPGVGQILVHGNLGFTTPVATPAAVLPLGVITDGNTFPFVQQHTGVVISGDAVNIDAYGGIGNVVITGTLQSLIANYAVSSGVGGAVSIPGQFDGIVGPIYGDMLLNIDIGQGLLPSGSGNVGFSGIYATGTIGTIQNIGNPNGDIRGNIVSSDTAGTNYAIGAITLHNASIIGANIFDLAGTDYTQTTDLYGGVITLTETTETPFASPYQYEIGSVSVSGLGGILGSDIEGSNIGPITVSGGGFGVLESHIISVGTGRIAGITASGYGIRDTDIEDGAYVGPIDATGNGSLVSILKYPIDVRQSDVPNTLDPYFGVVPTIYTDLDSALGVTGLTPNVANVTDTGVIQDCILEGQETLAGLTAQKVRTEEPLDSPPSTTTTSVSLNIPVIGQVFPMELNFPGGIGSIHIYQLVDGLQVTTGKIGSLSLSSDVNRVGISVAGPIGSVVIRGNFGQYVNNPETNTLVPDSYLSAGGANGTIASLTVLGNLNADVYASAEISNVLVTGDVEGGIITFGSTNGLTLGTLRVLGGIRDGSLILDGNVGSIIASRTLGTSAGALTVHGNANLISVGANHALHGSQLALALDVTGTLKNLVVYGSITGSVTTGGDLNHLTVLDDGSTPNAITGNITVGGRLGTASVVNGNITSNIQVTGNIGSFTLTRGDLNAGAVVQSQIGVLGSFRVTGGKAYSVYGSILAAESTNGSIDISGNLGDGVNAAVITAYSGKSLHIRGTVAPAASVTYASYLNLLQVDGSVLAGTTITAHPIKKQKIAGIDSGVITAV